jgi:prepilin-type N-terminal cleavage/methylation domain-containing protein
VHTRRRRFHPKPVRAAFTLIELVVVCAVIGIVVAIAAPGVRTTVDSLAVEAAARDAASALALGRLAALRHGGAEVHLDSLSITVRTAGRDLFTRDIARTRGVRMRASPAVVRYAATGMGTGLSNGSIVFTRGTRADTVFISRLGRVRRTK